MVFYLARDPSGSSNRGGKTMPLSADTLEAAYPAAELLDLVGCYISRRSGIRVFELRRGRVFVQPGSLEPSAPGGGKFGLGILECSDEAVERTGAVLDAIEPPIPLIAGRIAAGLVDRSTAPGATSRSTISSASVRLQRLRLACRSGAQLIPILATRYGWARPGHACLWTDILNPFERGAPCQKKRSRRQNRKPN